MAADAGEGETKAETEMEASDDDEAGVAGATEVMTDRGILGGEEGAEEGVHLVGHSIMQRTSSNALFLFID